MREPGDILLVSAYELGHPPLGIATPAAFLERAGYRPTLLDISVEALDPEKLKAARFVLISVPMHTALRLGVRVAERTREHNPDAHICFSGLYAALNADYLLEQHADSVLAGELEDALIARIEGVSPASAAITTLKKLQFSPPSRTRLPTLDRYAKLSVHGEERLAGAVESSRGCKYLCRHCPIPPVYGGRVFVVPQQVVLDDIASLVAQGAEHITFADPDFLNVPRHAIRIARALHAAHPALTFDITVRIEHILTHADLLPELAANGCNFAVSAVESLSDAVLDILDKGHTRADVLRAFELTAAVGIALRPSFVAFTPWTTLDDYLELFDFVIDGGLTEHVEPVQFAVRLLIPPGSLLEDHPAMVPHLLRLIPEGFTWTWRHPDPRMDTLCAEIRVIAEQGGPDALRRMDDAARNAAGLAARNRDRERTIAGAMSNVVPRLTEPWFC